MAHFLFNLVTDLIAFALMIPLLTVISEVLDVHDPLFALVAFHSIFNVIGILLFLPFVQVFADFLRQQFLSENSRVARHCNADTVELPETAVVAMEKDIRDVIDFAITIAVRELDLQLSNSVDGRFLGDFDAAYKNIKQMEGELLLFQNALMERKMDHDLTARASELLDALRHAVFSTKALKDMRDDLQGFRHRAGINAWQYLKCVLVDLTPLYNELLVLRDGSGENISSEMIDERNERLKTIDHESMKKLYREADDLNLSEIDLSTMLNVIREMRVASENLGEALFN